MVEFEVGDGRVSKDIVDLVLARALVGVGSVEQSVERINQLTKTSTCSTHVHCSSPLGSWISTSMLFSIPLP